jgi:hypothetical protein
MVGELTEGHYSQKAKEVRVLIHPGVCVRSIFHRQNRTSRFFLFSHLEEQSITALSTGNREIREAG